MKNNGLSTIDVTFRIESGTFQTDDGMADSIALLIDENEKLRRMVAFLISQTEDLQKSIVRPKLRGLR